MDAIENKSRRILALGIVFFVVGLALFIFEKPQNQKTVLESNQYAPAQVSFNSVFASYPPPEKFQHFSYDGASVAKNIFLELKSECKDFYFAVLIFKADFDYRNDPARAVFNRAAECPKEGRFGYDLSLNELGSIATGDYYVIVADQGKEGLWYNPR